MLEELAYRFLEQGYTVRYLTGSGAVVLGGTVAALVWTEVGRLQRAPYFALSALLLLASAVVESVQLAQPQMAAAGLLWAILLIDMLRLLVFGFLYGVVAMARSQDAYGTRGYAVLAFAPVANLILLFRPSKDDAAAGGAWAVALRGRRGVVCGLLATMAAFLAIEVQRRAGTKCGHTCRR
ncbi:hypothetical protein [Defluviicoccus vanus]|uniref:Uncharacterized protein n=1 Tax=Defluviicoccus vanus TaxID=111831 RepID=A0A7H1MZW7_9PROT|nr:hypothetical protein [Defluviicoccus vanus]QNT69003.1 hypothetical protein HQ394_06115 [Defluviicoccus vanus]